MKESSDETLMKRFQRGDEEAFVTIMERYQQRIFNYFLRQLYNHTLSEDLTQDVFIRIFKYGQSFDCRQKFRPWLYKIALNQLRKELKLRLNDVQCNKELVTQYPSYIFIDYELVEAVKNAINQLPSAQREVVILKQYQGMTFSEIAQVLGCPEATVKSRLYQAFTKLRKKLGKYRR